MTTNDWLLILSAIALLGLIIGGLVWFFKRHRVKDITAKIGLSPSLEIKYEPKPEATDNPPPSAPSSPASSFSIAGNAQIIQAPAERVIQSDQYIENYHAAPETQKPPAGSALPRRQRVFVPRGKIMDEVRQALKAGSAAIVGMHGMGGVGKTELAKFLAGELKDEFKDGVWWIEVASRPIEIVQGELARALGIKLPEGADDRGRHATLCATLQGRRALLIFDDIRKNFALEYCLPPEPCSALVTSRLQDLTGLDKTFPLDVMTEAQAWELLCVEVTREVVDQEPEAAKKLCAACAYHPLALVLAAARLRKRLNVTAPLQTFVAHLTDRLKQLRINQNNKDASLEANFDLSYQELDDNQKKRWRQLTVFAPSGFALPAVAHLWQVAETEATEHLYDLENASLVTPSPLGENRLRLHDLLREYAAQKLSEANESEIAHRALAEFLSALFDKHYTDDLSTAPHVGLELDNLIETANWALAHKEGDLLAQLSTQPRNWIYNIFRINNQWLTWLEASLQFGIEAKQLKANVLQAMGDVQQFRDDRDAALKSYEQALKLFKEIGAKLGEANVLQAMGDVQQFRDDRDAALKSYEQALKLFKEIGAKLGEANVLQAMGDVQQFRKELDAALKTYEQALKLFKEIGAKLGEANVLQAMGDVQQFRKELNAALKTYEQALKLFREDSVIQKMAEN